MTQSSKGIVMKKILITTALLVTTAHAAVYMQESPNGSINYSDTPSSDAKKITVPTVNSITTKHEDSTPATKSETESPAENQSDNTAPGSEATIYQKIEIVSPKNQETITNQPSIPVQVKTEPALQPTDKVQVMLDDSPVGTPVSSSYQEIGLVDRGTHTLSAMIIGPDNQVKKTSETITIYVHRNTKILSPTGN